MDARLVRFGAPAARVTVSGDEDAVSVEADVTIRPGEAKRVVVNGAPLASAEELRSRLSALVFVPDRLAVVKGSPLVRRVYFDRMLGRLFPARARVPSAYGRALMQRNEALRRVRAGMSDLALVEPWTRAVAEAGRELESARAELVRLLAPRFAELAERLGLAGATVAYEERPLTEAALGERLERDLARGVTGAGPHLRDVAIAAGGRELRAFGSQGEQRVAVLALVLAEAGISTERRGSPPLLLLDDVMSELDDGRRSALLEGLPAGAQTVVTATTRDALPAGAEPELVLAVTPGNARAV